MAIEGAGREEVVAGFDPFAEARAHGQYEGLTQDPGESDEKYRSRVAGVLRDQGRIIEAHEVLSGRRYDDPEHGSDGPMVGIVGALAESLEGINFPGASGERQVGDDIAIGLIARSRQEGDRWPF